MPTVLDRTKVDAKLVNVQNDPFRADFPLLASHPGLAFLDTAATAQRPAAVLDAQRRFYEQMNANPLRGLYKLSVEATEAIDDVRAKVARFIGADAPNDVVFTRNASEALNIVAKSFGPTVLKPGDQVAITIMEHHSNLIPWQQVCEATGAELVYLYPEKTGKFEDGYLERMLGEGSKVKVCALTEVSNVLGVRTPVEKVAELVHARGGYVVVDGAQSTPHMPVDVARLGADFFAFSAHKLGGPMGIGVLWGKRDLLEAMPPFLTGGEMIDSVTEHGFVPAPVPQKFEAGTQDAAGIYATGAAIDYLERVGWDTILVREDALMHYLFDKLSRVPHVKTIGSIYWSDHHGVLSFNLEGIHPHDVASILDGEDVCIRAGHHCAQPLLAWYGVENGACCRASLGFYNTSDDIDKLADGLVKVWETFHPGE